MNVFGLLFNPVIDSLAVQRDIQEWLQYVLRAPLAYPLRFALAAGLILLIFGLVAFALSVRAEHDHAGGDWMVAELRARKRKAILVSMFCLLGIVLGVQVARFTISEHSTAPQQPVPIPHNPAGQVAVWEDPRHGVYHCSGSGWFGKTHGGKVASLQQAQYDGYRPYARPCPLDQTRTQSSLH